MSHRKPTALASQAARGVQVQETLVLSTEVTLKKSLPLNEGARFCQRERDLYGRRHQLAEGRALSSQDACRPTRRRTSPRSSTSPWCPRPRGRCRTSRHSLSTKIGQQCQGLDAARDPLPPDTCCRCPSTRRRPTGRQHQPKPRQARFYGRRAGADHCYGYQCQPGQRRRAVLGRSVHQPICAADIREHHLERALRLEARASGWPGRCRRA